MVSTPEKGWTVSVLIADDHVVVRDGLRAALAREPDMKLVAEAGNGQEAMDKALQFKPDVVILDIFMPVRTGLEVMLSIKHHLPRVKVLFLTISEREDDLLQAIRLGADGYLLKKSSLAEVVDAVRRVAGGEAILSPAMTVKVMRELREGPKIPSLSDREKEVLALVSRGLTTAEMAEKLFLSPGTVTTYVHRLLQKLHLKNKAEAVAYFFKHRTAAGLSPDTDDEPRPGNRPRFD